VQAAYTYDAAGRLLGIVHTSSVGGTIASFTYTLDAVGNRTQEVADGTRTTQYTYDALHRLKTVAYPDGEQVSYAYDPMGNRTAMTSTVSGVTLYTYDAADRLLSFTDAGGATALTWDANGNMTGKGAAAYTFDPLDRLTQVVSGTTTVQFAYNGDGVRLGKTVNGVATAYVQDVQASLPVVLAETAGGQTSVYVYGNDLLERADGAGVPVFYHADGLGSTRALSDGAGALTDAYTYDAFGATRSHAGGAGQPFMFAGEQGDGEVGLVFLRARYMDPQVGRFVSRDLFPGIAVDMQSINRYAYARNNPTLLVDPDGELAHIVATTAAGVGWGLLSQAATDVFEYAATGDTNVDWRDYAGAAAGGAAKGALSGVGCIGPCSMIVGEATSSVVKTGVHDLLAGERSSLGTYAGNAALSVAANAMAKHILPGKSFSEVSV
jgi:RHS repeat-associated protein